MSQLTWTITAWRKSTKGTIIGLGTLSEIAGDKEARPRLVPCIERLPFLPCPPNPDAFASFPGRRRS